MIYLLLFFTFNKFILSNALQCKDADNISVDWFATYKIPKIKHENPFVQSGTAYTYITNNYYESWKLSNIYINDSNSIIGNTLKPLFNNKNIAYLIYNDQPPDAPSEDSKGHTKGIILADETSGLWLIHSVPHFPNLSTNYSFPTTGIIYGQSFLCISLDLQNLNEIGLQLQYNEPHIYSYNIPSNIQSSLPHLVEVTSGITVKSPPWYRKTEITSLGRTAFTSYAKSKHFLKDLYEDWLAPDLQTNLYVETWPKGPGKLSSNCSKPFKVYNVESVNITVAQTEFDTTHDHSKWAVSETANSICIGDINRMEHQKSRGGGTVCLMDKILSNDYLKLVANIEHC